MKVADRVGQYSNSSGKEDFLLYGELPLHQKFVAGIGYKSECYYTCLSEASGQWEIGVGYFDRASGKDVLHRKAVLSSSEGGRKVAFSSGKKAIFISLPSQAVKPLVDQEHLASQLEVRGDASGKFAMTDEGRYALETNITKIQGVEVNNNPSPKGTKVLGIEGYLYASRVHNPVWNDVVDYQQLNDELIMGRCYYDTVEGAKLCTQRCQKGVIGIASDTYGMAVGSRLDQTQVPIAVAGWVLAYVDKIYETGTPLTNDERGFLTEMTLEEKSHYPERLVATFKKPEYDKQFGPSDHKIKVDGRCWVKVK